ncbi:MAG: SpoIIE family protein phosphatase [bacterium]|nr:SpoIIE family protein phosphatase [bacterium]
MIAVSSFIHIVYAILSVVFIVMVILAIFYKKKYNSIKNSLHLSKQKNEEINDFMKFFSETLSNTLKLSEVYTSIAIHISNIIEAKSICIYELEEDGYLHSVGFTEQYPPLQCSADFKLSKPRYAMDSVKHEKIKFGEGIIGEIAAKKKGIIITEASSDTRLESASNIISINTLMALPMMMNGEVMGVICAINTKSNKQFNTNQYESLEAMTKLVALIHNIIKSYSNLTKQQRISQELDFTRLLQSSLLPKKFPIWKPFVIHAFTRSAKEVSGDFYDFVEIDKDRLLVVLGDASGKGIPACMVMAMTRSFIRANAERFTTLREMLDELNTNLYRDTDEGRFTTLSCCLLDRKEKTVEFARAGHTELLIFSSKQKIRKVRPHGSALGLLPQDIAGSFDSFSFTFKPYYSMILFSDGIVEAINSENKEFGLEKLENIFYESCIRKNTPSKCTEKILRNLDEFSSEQERFDDQTMMIISHEDSFI